MKREAKNLIISGCLFLFTLYFLNISTSIAAGPGSTGAQFLRIGLGARPVAMGGAFSALADDVNAIYWNPAGLSQLKEKEIITSYLRYFAGINSGFLGYHHPIQDIGNAGLAVSYLGVSDIEKRTSDTEEPDSIFTATDMSWILSFARENIFLENLSVGANIKLITQRIDTESAIGLGFDIGFLYKSLLMQNLNFGFVIQNVGIGPKFISIRDPLPLGLKAGIYYKLFDVVNLTSDVDWFLIDQKLQWSLGAEYWFMDMVAPRIGYKFGTDVGGFGTGIGFAVYEFRLDYAFVPYGDLGNSHRVSLSFRF